MAEVDVYAKCPFYSGVRGSKLRCEGSGHIAVVTVQYDSSTHMFSHKIAKCDNDYVKCPIFKRLEEIANEQIQKQKGNVGRRNDPR